MAHLTFENLSFTYPGADRKALDGISLTIEKGAFVTLMGATGSGKSTLLRLCKPELHINGLTEGEIYYENKKLTGLSTRDGAEKIGYVAQEPEEQIVTDKVWHELAFTLENLGCDRTRIARRTAEIAACFDMEAWYERDTATLSGGEKQLLNLAAVMTADPELLLLDEPTAQLDPIAASRFIDMLARLNRETGLTVVICEHRAEELFPISDEVIVLEEGHILYRGAPREVAAQIGGDSLYRRFLPAAAQLYHSLFHAVPSSDMIPLSVREGQRFVQTLGAVCTAADAPAAAWTEPALTMKHIRFRYERNGADILNDLELEIFRGEVYALLGANGAGKTTAALVAAGLRRPYAGSVKLFGKRLREYKNGSLYRDNISLLPQDTESVFLHETVGEELKGGEDAVEKLPYDLKPLYDRHPYDLSGGERQLVALCKALSAHPRLLIMDEPSKGLDGSAKALLCRVIRDLKKDGVTVLLITHDVEFAALCADRCALFACGRIAAQDSTDRFMSENRFYTTACSRITRRRCDGAYTVERAAAMFGKNGGAR